MSARGSAWLLPLVLLVGCGAESTEASEGGAKAPAGGAAAQAGFEVQGDVVTPEEADAQAEKAITAENADEEFEKLKKELDG